MLGTSSDDLYKELKEIPNIYLYRKGDKNLTKFHLSKNRRFMEFLLEAKDGFIMGNNDTLRTFGLGKNLLKIHKRCTYIVLFLS